MLTPTTPDQAVLLRALLAARSGTADPSRITVVGNAPLEPSAERAARIDASDLVIRMTTFALDTDVPRLGIRTDAVVLHRAARPGPGTFAQYETRVYLLAEPGRDFWEPEPQPAWWPRDLGIVPISNRDFTDGLRAEMGIRRRTVAWPTTGTLAVHLAHRLFPHASVLLTGSSLRDGPASAGGFDHQWGDRVTLTPEHRLDLEGVALRRWIADGWLEVAR